MKQLLAILLSAFLCFGQQHTIVSLSDYPADGPTQYNDYDANGNLAYVCITRPVPLSSSLNSYYSLSLTIAATTLTNIVVSANTATLTAASAHGLRPNQLITVSGATVDSDLNGTYIILTVPSTTTFTFTTANVSNATYTDAGLAVAVSQTPLLTSPIWSINKKTYDSNGNLTDNQWANGNRTDYGRKCSDRAVTSGSTKLTYK